MKNHSTFLFNVTKKDLSKNVKGKKHVKNIFMNKIKNII